MTREELKRLMQEIQDEYRDFGINQSKFDFWYECLGECDALMMHKALCRYAKMSHYTPNIAGLYKQYEEVKKESDRDREQIVNCFDATTHIYPFGDINESKAAFVEYLNKHEDKVLAAERLRHEARKQMDAYDQNGTKDIPPLVELIRRLT